MTTDELRDWLAARDMGVNDLARLVDVAQRTAARWVSGENPVPGPLVMALALITHFNISDDDARRIRDAYQAAPQKAGAQASRKAGPRLDSEGNIDTTPRD